MLRYTIKRFAVALLVAVTVSLVTFSLLELSGDPAAAMAGESATAEDIAFVREMYGFDRPFLVRYADWASRAVTGDLGYSYYLRTDVSGIILSHLPVTMTLGAC